MLLDEPIYDEEEGITAKLLIPMRLSRF